MPKICAPHTEDIKHIRLGENGHENCQQREIQSPQHGSGQFDQLVELQSPEKNETPQSDFIAAPFLGAEKNCTLGVEHGSYEVSSIRPERRIGNNYVDGDVVKSASKPAHALGQWAAQNPDLSVQLQTVDLGTVSQAKNKQIQQREWVPKLPVPGTQIRMGEHTDSLPKIVIDSMNLDRDTYKLELFKRYPNYLTNDLRSIVSKDQIWFSSNNKMFDDIIRIVVSGPNVGTVSLKKNDTRAIGIMFDKDQAGLRLVIITIDPDKARILETQSHVLRARLEAHGIDIHEIKVSLEKELVDEKSKTLYDGEREEPSPKETRRNREEFERSEEKNEQRGMPVDEKSPDMARRNAGYIGRRAYTV